MVAYKNRIFKTLRHENVSIPSNTIFIRRENIKLYSNVKYIVNEEKMKIYLNNIYKDFQLSSEYRYFATNYVQLKT